MALGTMAIGGPVIAAWTRRLALQAALVALLGVPAARSQDATLTIALGGDGLHFSALHVAQGAGFFSQAGITVQWVDVGNGPKQMAAVLGGSADLAPIGAADVIKAVNKNLKPVALATTFDVYPTTLVLSNAAIAKTGITPEMPVDEKVKRIAAAHLNIGITSPGSATDDFIRSLLKARGYDPDKVVSLQPVGSGPTLYAAFEKGAVEGFVWFSPYTDLAAVNKLGQVVISPFTGDVPEMNGVPYLLLTTSRATLDAKKPLLEKALVAYTRALKLMADDPAAARKLLSAHFADMNPTALNIGLDTYLKAMPKRPMITPQAMEKNATWMSLTAAAPVKADYAKLVAPELAQMASDTVFGK